MNHKVMKARAVVYYLLLFAFFGGFGQGISDGPLGDLHMQKEGRLVQYSSADPTGGNSDRRPIEPGEKLVLLDHEGAGIIRRWWITIAPRNNQEILRSLIVRCYWDGEENPSVEVPVADFFGMGFGEWKDYISLPLNMTSGGYNCYWPMPFKEKARIVVENTGSVPIESFYYNIGVRTFDSISNQALYFHAQYRQATTREGTPVTILETSGSGHYVGTLLSMQPQQGAQLGYLEGDEVITIDGEEEPSIVGTGTEDYFSSGWYYLTGEYSAPYHGVTIKNEENGRINTYRWHIEDPIPFREAFKFVIEHGGTNDMPDVEYSSVAYWYQTHPHSVFLPLPESLIPLSTVTEPSIEAEELLEVIQVESGELEIQDMSNFNGKWSGDRQLWWINAKPGSKMLIPLTADEAGEYDLYAFFTRARDYGVVQASINGQEVGNLIDLYNTTVESTGPIRLGSAVLKKGRNDLEITLLGKDVRSSGFSNGYLVGFDGFHLIRK